MQMDPARRQVYDKWRESGVAVTFTRWEGVGGSREQVGGHGGRREDGHALGHPKVPPVNLL